MEQLKNEAKSYQLVATGRKGSIVEAILEHLVKLPSGSEGSEQEAEAQEGADQPGDPPENDRNGAQQERVSPAGAIERLLETFAEQIQQQNLLMMDRIQQAVQAVSATGTQVTRSVVNEAPRSRPAPVDSPPRSEGRAASATSYVGSIPPANAVTVLALQIPEFSGSDEDNIVHWIQRVDRVAMVHRASSEVILLAASSKLRKEAKKWYDFQKGTTLESWSALKSALRRVFERKLPYYVLIQKVEARRWNWTKETFQHYVIDKLALMEPLDLSDKDAIHLLIGGIGKPSLRATAATIGAETIDEFLDRMRSITAASADHDRKPQGNRQFKPKETTGKKEERSKPTTKVKTIVCFACGEPGHLKPDCPKRTPKERPNERADGAVKVLAVSETEDSEEEEVQMVAAVQEKNKFLEISNVPLIITFINNCKCRLKALVDTGSPASFVRKDVFGKFFARDDVTVKHTTRNFNALNNLPIRTAGSVKSKICFEQLADSQFDIELNVLENDKFSNDLIIGRDFLTREKITVIYKPEEEVLLLPQFDVCEVSSIIESKIDDCKIDFDEPARQQLKQVILETENAHIPIENDKYCVRVKLKDKSVYSYAPRRFAVVQREQIREIIEDLLARDIIQPSVSSYCARVVPVRKKNGSMRMCVDLRPLNNRVEKQRYPFPLIEDCLLRLSNKKVFTVLDLKDGFHQIKVHPEDTKYFSFATPDGQYEYKRLPFGFSESPAEFQKRLVNILKDLIREDKVIVYIDDIMIASETVDENLETLKRTLHTLKRYELELNYDKCQFLRRTVQYLGYIISEEGITLSSHHTEAVRNFPKPKNMVEVQRFLGLTSYFRKFIKNFADRARPLYNLLKKDSNFNFDESCDKAFELLKVELTAYPVLRIYNPKAETELHTDASALGLAAILLQRQKSGSLAPVAYFSQSTNSAESRYHSFELEMLAIVKAVERFHIYLYGLEFTVITDCNALVYAVNKANLNPRIARWTLALQNYRFKVAHRPGKRMAHVDALSRQVALVDALPVETELVFRQLQDSRIKEIASALENKEDEKYEIIDGLVYRKGEDRSRFFVPELMINNIIRVYHDEMAHCGFEKTVYGITATSWFPSLRKRVQTYIDNCIICLMANTSGHTREGEIQIGRLPNSPFDTLHLDHFGPLPETEDGFRHVLVVIDAFTRYTWLLPSRSNTSQETCSNLQWLFNIFGTPKNIVTDRGSAFTSREFTHLVEKYKVQHRQVAVASPWANGLAERVNRFLKTSLAKTIVDPKLWVDSAARIQYVMNNTTHAAIKSTPSQLLLGYGQRNHSDIELKELIDQLAHIDRDIDGERTRTREVAIEATEKLRNYNKVYYDKKHRKPTLYKEKDLVLIRDLQGKAGQSKKMKSNYKGPYLIAKVLNNNRYVIRDVPGFNLSGKPYNTILSPDKLKPWNKNQEIK